MSRFFGHIAHFDSDPWCGSWDSVYLLNSLGMPMVLVSDSRISLLFSSMYWSLSVPFFNFLSLSPWLEWRLHKEKNLFFFVFFSTDSTLDVVGFQQTVDEWTNLSTDFLVICIIGLLWGLINIIMSLLTLVPGTQWLFNKSELLLIDFPSKTLSFGSSLKQLFLISFCSQTCLKIWRRL